MKTNAIAEIINKHKHMEIDKNVIAGNWIRTDGGYRIEMSELGDDGKMKASYFNPKSINVAEARWTNKDGTVKIYIELRDVNYPGSRYNLSYMQPGDKLSGEYFQAVEGTTYKVEFTRQK